jgi:hypothetical protein
VDEQLIADVAFDEAPFKTLRIEETSYHRDNLDVETIVEQICDELEGAVDRDVVDQVVQEMAFRYQDARVKAFVPIFVKRDAMDLLRRI